MNHSHLTEKWTGQQQSHQRADSSPIADQTTNFPPESLERCTGLARAITAHCIQPERQQRSDRAFIIMTKLLYYIFTRDINIFNYYLLLDYILYYYHDWYKREKKSKEKRMTTRRDSSWPSIRVQHVAGIRQWNDVYHHNGGDDFCVMTSFNILYFYYNNVSQI